MKKGVLFIFGIFIILITLNQILALSVGNSIPIQIQTTDTPGNIITGTFNFTINISNSSTCSPVLYSNTTIKTTDARGIVSYNLENISLEFDEQYWFCYYRDSILKQTTKIARTPYAFRAKNITLSGVEVDSNFNLSSYNFTTLGWVGIGTASPERKLHVNSTEAVQALFKGTNVLGSFVDIDTDAVDRDAIVRFQENGSSKWMIGVDGNDSDKFKIGWVGFPNTRLTIDSSGKVGIGTASPDAQLTVHSAVLPMATLRRLSDTNGTSNYLYLEHGATDALATSIIGSVLDVDVANGTHLTFQTAKPDTGTTTEKMRIQGDGKVGIGTTAPEQDLHIKDATANVVQILETDKVNGIARFELRNDAQQWDMRIRGDNVDEFALLDGTNSKFPFLVESNTPSNTLYLDSTGNVGIGTTNPVAKLHVETPSGNDIAIRIRQAGVQSWEIMNPASTSRLDFYNVGSGTTPLTLTTNVGIGTTTPDRLFHIRNAAAAGEMVVQGVQDVNVGNNATIWLSTAYTSDIDQEGQQGRGAAIQGIANSAWGVNVRLAFKTSNDSSTYPQERMTIAPSGNVGIGTTSPVAHLDIRDTGSGSDVIGNGTLTLGLDYNYWNFRQTATPLSDLAIDRVYSATPYEVMRIQRSTGNVGIGTAAPYRKLEVNGEFGVGNATDGIVMWMTDGIGKIAGIDMDSGGYNDIEIRAQAGTQLYLKTDGNVGIGTTTPSEKLEVNGTVHITSLEGTYSNGEAYVCVYNNGTIFAKDSACS